MAGLPEAEEVAEVEEGLHSHCALCIFVRKCSARGAWRAQARANDSCPIIGCPLGCGAQYHGCKSSEHRLLCPQEKVTCLNAPFGCGLLMLRSRQVGHLLRCPASVVHCSLEWNRWPLHTREKRLTHPVMSQSLDANHQLDVALALRDQRMLQQLWSAPKKARCSLRNHLTRKYPAVPLKPYHGLHTEDSRGSLSPSSPVSTPSLLASQTVSDDDSDSSPWRMQTKNPPGLQSSVCAKLNGHPEVHLNGDTHFEKMTFNRTPVIAETETEPIHLEHEQKRPLVPQCINRSPSESPIAPPPPPSLPQCSLSLDLNIDVFAPYQPKPKLMYTFRCAQEFRRDEYEGHYRNVHSEIHGAMNGWMEHRCPMFQYGCSFAQRRVHPQPLGSKIVFSTVSESFGLLVVPDGDCRPQPPGGGDISLALLPFEILQHICKYLDSFSLNNLSLTCRRLRDMSATLLDNRGLVVLQWERVRAEDGSHKWLVGHKSWFFSTSFSRIDEWFIEGNNAVLRHMQSCPQYEKIIKTEPYKLPVVEREEESKKHI